MLLRYECQLLAPFQLDILLLIGGGGEGPFFSEISRWWRSSCRCGGKLIFSICVCPSCSSSSSAAGDQNQPDKGRRTGSQLEGQISLNPKTHLAFSPLSPRRYSNAMQLHWVHIYHQLRREERVRRGRGGPAARARTILSFFPSYPTPPPRAACLARHEYTKTYQGWDFGDEIRTSWGQGWGRGRKKWGGTTNREQIWGCFI